MDPHERATSCWYRVAGLVSREQKDLAVEIIEAESRSAQHEVFLDAARLVLSGEPIEIARQLRARAQQTIKLKECRRERGDARRPQPRAFLRET